MASSSPPGVTPYIYETAESSIEIYRSRQYYCETPDDHFYCADPSCDNYSTPGSAAMNAQRSG